MGGRGLACGPSPWSPSRCEEAPALGEAAEDACGPPGRGGVGQASPVSVPFLTCRCQGWAPSVGRQPAPCPLPLCWLDVNFRQTNVLVQARPKYCVITHDASCFSEIAIYLDILCFYLPSLVSPTTNLDCLIKEIPAEWMSLLCWNDPHFFPTVC